MKNPQQKLFCVMSLPGVRPWLYCGPGNSHSRGMLPLLAIPDTLPACFAHLARQASIPRAPPWPNLTKYDVCTLFGNHSDSQILFRGQKEISPTSVLLSRAAQPGCFGTVKYYAQIHLQVWQNSVCTGQGNLPLITQ